MSKLNAWLRAKQKIFLVIVCCVCMVTFVVGPGVLRLLDPDPTRGGSVFGKEVSGKRVMRIARSLLPFFGENRPSDPEIFAHAWELLIMDQEADRYNITVSENEVADFLAGRFAASGGGFDATQYAAFLRQSRITPADYEETLGLILRDYKVRAAVQQSVVLSEDEAWMCYTQDRQQVKARYVTLDAAALSALTSPGADEVRAFYEKYQDIPKGTGPYGAGYQRPERVKIEYVLAPRKVFEKQATVSEEDILKYYQEHKADYAIPDKNAAEESDDAAIADETEKDITAYKPLAKVRSDIEKTLRQEATTKAMSDTMKKVNEAIWKALDVPFGSQEAGVVDLKEIATRFNLEHVQETDFFEPAECDKILPGAPELRQRAFNQGMSGIGVVSPRLKARDGEFIFRLLESKPPEPLPFDDVKKSVEKHYRQKLAAELAQTMASRASETPDFDTAVETTRNAITGLLEKAEKPAARKKAGDYFTVGETPFFGRVRTSRFGENEHRFHIGAGLPGNANSTNFADTAFNLKDGEIGLATDSETAPKYFFVLERSGIEFPSRQAFERDKTYVMPQLLSEKRANVLKTWQTDLRTRANPSPEVMKYLELLPHWAG